MKDGDTLSLKNELTQLKQVLKSYEDQSLKYSETEKKFKLQMMKKEKDLKVAEQKISSLNQKIERYEEMVKINKSLKTIKLEDESESTVNSYLTTQFNDYSHNNAEPSSISRKSPLPSTERKIPKVNNKLDHYKKLIDAKINEATKNKSISQSDINCDHANRSNSNVSKNKSIPYYNLSY